MKTASVSNYSIQASAVGPSELVKRVKEYNFTNSITLHVIFLLAQVVVATY
jgi:hypothetical protein